MKRGPTTHHTTRRIWALVTAEPHLTLRAIQKRLKLSSVSLVSRHLGYLEQAGYIQQAYGTKYGNLISKFRRVLVPFHGGPVVIRKIRRQERAA